MRLHVLCECDGYMQEYAPRLSALGMVCLGGCPASRVEDRVKHSNVRLKIITSIPPIFKGLPESTFLTYADLRCTALKLLDRVSTTAISN